MILLRVWRGPSSFVVRMTPGVSLRRVVRLLRSFGGSGSGSVYAKTIKQPQIIAIIKIKQITVQTMNATLQIIPTDLLEIYRKQVRQDLQSALEGLSDAELSTDTFSFYTSVSSVYSSKIEGEEIELDSYIKHKRFGIEFLPDYTKKTDDLYDAYTYAKTQVLHQENLEAAHKLLSKHLVVRHQQGKMRTQNMYVSTPDGKIEYVAAAPFEVASEMEKLYADIDTLLAATLDPTEVFFFASMIHLVFVKIHPSNAATAPTHKLLPAFLLSIQQFTGPRFGICRTRLFKSPEFPANAPERPKP